ncbi:MAG: sialate O-acetylesterase [Ginsengibacter sp.]
MNKAENIKDVKEKVNNMPSKENFYIFILAGQSNMAGRGIVEPQDTIASQYVLSLNSSNEWIYAKEPLHYYEPERAGLDCGLSFGKSLSVLYGKNITIGLIPCAVGGSSIEQWLGDSTHRGVKLYSNLLNKTKAASEYGVIKGMIWHQGENNATATDHSNFFQNLKTFFEKLRADNNDPELPIYAGELGSYLKSSDYPNKDSVNRDLHLLSNNIENIYIINTSDFTSMKDTVHFDSRSQRLMGERFAEAVFKNSWTVK